MDHVYTYQIEVRGQMDTEDLRAGSPLQITLLESDATTVRLAVCTDQSGLIGLIRYLHQRGLALKSVGCR